MSDLADILAEIRRVNALADQVAAESFDLLRRMLATMRRGDDE